jgi:hypothetical protein
MFSDQVSPLAHMNARDTSFVLVSRAPQPQIERFARRMGWSIPWYTVVGEEFQKACGTSEYFALDVFLCSSPMRPPAAASRRSAACGRSST